jgi:membrane associated rhomboid family serine protease
MNYYKIKKKSNISSKTRFLSITAWLIIVTIIISSIVFILTAISEKYIDYVALKPENIIHGQYLWTILTSIFVHASLFHLFFNMFSLYFVGSLIEKIIGRKRLLYFYIIAGITAGLIFALLAGFFGYGFLGKIFGTPQVSGVGASGAIFGLVGLLAVLVPKSRVYLIAGPLIAIILGSILEYIVPASSNLLGLLNGAINVYIIISIFTIFSPNPKTRAISIPLEMSLWMLPIAAIVPLVILGIFIPLPIGNVAHFGGLIVGLAYGLFLRIKYKRKIKMLQQMFK